MVKWGVEQLGAGGYVNTASNMEGKCHSCDTLKCPPELAIQNSGNVVDGLIEKSLQ